MLTAVGTVTPLTSRKPSLYSQQRRDEETPVFVSQFGRARHVGLLGLVVDAELAVLDEAWTFGSGR
jgi:hypothetical protein